MFSQIHDFSSDETPWTAREKVNLLPKRSSHFSTICQAAQCLQLYHRARTRATVTYSRSCARISTAPCFLRPHTRLGENSPGILYISCLLTQHLERCTILAFGRVKMSVLDAILDMLMEDAPVSDIRVCAFWTAVVVGSQPARCGLASTLSPGHCPGTTLVPESGDLLNYSARQLAGLTRSNVLGGYVGVQ